MSDDLLREDISFDEIIDRRSQSSLKWTKYKDPDVIPLWLADMDFRVAAPIRDAVRRDTDFAVWGYTLPSIELKEAIAAWLFREHGWKVELDWIDFIPSAVSALYLASRICAEPGGRVICAPPIYPPFRTITAKAERVGVEIPLLRVGDEWLLDFEKIEAELKLGAKLFLFCSPHNPVGKVYSREELDTLFSLLRRYDAWLCSDELHSSLVLSKDKQHIPSAIAAGDYFERTITIVGPGKTFNISGLGVSVLIIPDASLRHRWFTVSDGVIPHVDRLAYLATHAAYAEGREWYLKLIDYLRENREIVARRVAEMPHISMHLPDATYLAWIHTGETIAGIKPAPFFEKYGVGLAPGLAFGDDNYLRLNFACPRSLLIQALDRMEEALARMS
ncbi:MAG: PatB family C-S lyase [bacterium]|nr:PatB family C-S lyase [bacterium]